MLALEQHDRPGGWTHSFTLSGYRFSPGVHYIGDLHEGGHLRNIYEGLGVSQDLTFCELNPDGYDHIIVGDKRVDFPKGKENLIERLKSQFPHEAKGIDSYFADLVGMTEALRNIGKLSNPMKAVGNARTVFKWARATGADLINTHISDPVLRGVLAGQAGDHGLPPSQVSAFMHAGITHHYLDGGYYPLGGAFALPRAFVRALKRSGGEIRLQCRVKRILVEGKKVIGVELDSGEEIRAGVVISNADPEVTFGQLIGRDHLSVKLRCKVDSVKYSTSCLSLFFATDMDLRRAAGLDSGNFWFYENEDVDKIYTDGLTDVLLREETPPGMFLTATTLKDPSKKHSGHHTCESFAFVGYEAFEKWANTKYGSRPANYDAMKEDLAWRMVPTKSVGIIMRGLEKHVPGLSKHIVFYSLGTPLIRFARTLSQRHARKFIRHREITTTGGTDGILAAHRVRRLVPVRREHDESWRGRRDRFGNRRGQGGAQLSHARFTETRRREFDVFAVGGYVRVARVFEEEDGTRGGGEGG